MHQKSPDCRKLTIEYSNFHEEVPPPLYTHISWSCQRSFSPFHPCLSVYTLTTTCHSNRHTVSEYRSSFGLDGPNWRGDWPLERSMSALLEDGGAPFTSAEGTVRSFQRGLPRGEEEGDKPAWISYVSTGDGLFSRPREIAVFCRLVWSAGFVLQFYSAIKGALPPTCTIPPHLSLVLTVTPRSHTHTHTHTLPANMLTGQFLWDH